MNLNSLIKFRARQPATILEQRRSHIKIEDWPSAKDIPALYRELKELDLLEHLAELEAFGYTVLPPEKVGSKEQLEETKTAVLKIAAERKGCKVE